MQSLLCIFAVCLSVKIVCRVTLRASEAGLEGA